MWNIWQPPTMCKHGKTAEQQWTMVLSGAQPVLVTVSSDSPDAAVLFQPVWIHFWHQTNCLIKHQLGFSWLMVYAFIQYVWYWGRLGAGGVMFRSKGIPSQGRKPLAWYHHLLTFLSTSPSRFLSPTLNLYLPKQIFLVSQSERKH